MPPETRESMARLRMSTAFTAGITSVDLATYVRVGRYNLPEPTRTTPPTDNLLCQEASGVAYNWDTDTLFIARASWAGRPGGCRSGRNPSPGPPLRPAGG